MNNFPYSENPLTWSSYYGHIQAKTLAKKYVLGGVSKLPRSMFISGPSGCGKTTFIKLLIRSFSCLNRKPEEHEPCGVCESCMQGDIRLSDRTTSNTIWVQPGGFTDEPETLGKQLKYALSEASKGQRNTNRPESDVLWVVCDEFQEFPSNLRAELLARAESEPVNNNVCYIFSTMQEDRLSVQELIALKRRGSPIYLSSFTTREIQTFLDAKYVLPVETSKLISENSDNSLGLAIAYYGNVKDIDPSMSVETAAYIVRAATNAERYYLWELIKGNSKYVLITEATQELLKRVSPVKFVLQLQHDILNTAELSVLTQDRITAIAMLNQFLQVPKSDLSTYLIPLRGMNLVTKEGVGLTEDNQLGYIL